ncbi:MAG: ISL3 family transposase [bacterium]|nr:ISL3 family transposase [bacterium]
MSTSLLYHGFGVRDYRYVSTRYVAGGVVFVIERKPDTYCCAACGSQNVWRHGVMVRSFRTVPLGSKRVELEAEIPRLACQDCGLVRQAAVGFAEPRRTYTKSFARYVLELSRHMTIKDVACHLGVGWDVVKEIQKKFLHKHFDKPKLKHVKQIAIDEISTGKGHKYVTIVLDLKSGAVLHVGRGKGGDALLPFWRRLRTSHARIEAVATDMSPAYIDAVTTNLPEATLVFDRFHVIKLYNEKLSDLRRDLHRQLADTMQKEVLKGVRWLLLKRPENLDASRREPERLQEALRLNEPLAIAYQLKDELNEIWEQDDQETAEALLLDWIVYAESTGIRMLKQFAKTLRVHGFGILAWYDYPISTGPLEGTNNKIKTMKRQAYGFRDPEFLRLKILAIHRTTYALVG